MPWRQGRHRCLAFLAAMAASATIGALLETYKLTTSREAEASWRGWAPELRDDARGGASAAAPGLRGEERERRRAAPAAAASARASNLEELTRLTEGREGTGRRRSNAAECPPPKKYYRNRMVFPRDDGDDNEDLRPIPKILHLSFPSRCLPQDIHVYMKRWEEKLPDHSIVFHDDHAVHDLIHAENYRTEWSRDFPWLAAAMTCVLNKGAMTIDVWRLLVLWKFGGIYADLDTWATDDFDTNATIPRNVSGFFFSDDSGRPTQWFMAMEEYHPLMYLNIERVVKNLLNLEKIEQPQLVYETGPKPTRDSYRKFRRHAGVSFDEYRRAKKEGYMSNGNKTTPETGSAAATLTVNSNMTTMPSSKVFVDLTPAGVDISRKASQSYGLFVGMSNKTLLKGGHVWKPGTGLTTSKGGDAIVEYYEYNVTTGGKTNVQNVTVKKRIALESGTKHWKSSTYGDEQQHQVCRQHQQRWRNVTEVQIKVRHWKICLNQVCQHLS